MNKIPYKRCGMFWTSPRVNCYLGSSVSNLRMSTCIKILFFVLHSSISTLLCHWVISWFSPLLWPIHNNKNSMAYNQRSIQTIIRQCFCDCICTRLHKNTVYMTLYVDLLEFRNSSTRKKYSPIWIPSDTVSCLVHILRLAIDMAMFEYWKAS